MYIPCACVYIQSHRKTAFKKRATNRVMPVHPSPHIFPPRHLPSFSSLFFSSGLPVSLSRSEVTGLEIDTLDPFPFCPGPWVWTLLPQGLCGGLEAESSVLSSHEVYNSIFIASLPNKVYLIFLGLETYHSQHPCLHHHRAFFPVCVCVSLPLHLRTAVLRFRAQPNLV